MVLHLCGESKSQHQERRRTPPDELPQPELEPVWHGALRITGIHPEAITTGAEVSRSHPPCGPVLRCLVAMGLTDGQILWVFWISIL